MAVKEVGTAQGAKLCQLLRENAGIARLIAGREGTASKIAAETGQRRFDRQHLGTAQYASINAMPAHDFGALGTGVEVGLRGEKMQDAALEPFVLDAGLRQQLLH